MEVIVDGAEGHYDKSDDEGGLQKGEYHSKKLVDPAKEDKIEQSFKKSSYKSEDDEDDNQYQGECHYLHDLLGCCDVLCHPCRYDIGESC